MSFVKGVLKPIRNLVYEFSKKVHKNYSDYYYDKHAKELHAKFRHYGGNGYFCSPYYIYNHQYISIGKNFSSLWNLRLEAWDEYKGQTFTPELIIGDNVTVNSDVHIGCINKVIIEDNVLLASRIYITDHFHGQISGEALQLAPVDRPLFSKGPVIIKKNVWIGEGVCIMPGITIGENAIIGANAVVTKDVPANSVVAGVPAQILKTL